MPRLTQSVPRYRKHRQSGQAIVTLNGRDHLLGPHGTQTSKREYDRLITEWLIRGRQPIVGEADGLTVVEAIARYWRHAKSHYVKAGRPSGEQHGIKSALRFLKALYGDTPAAEFGPIQLKAVRAKMIDHGLARPTINQHVSRICRMYRWLGSEQLVPVVVVDALRLVAGLRAGKTIAREPDPIRPVEDHVVDATLVELPEVVADMVRFQRLTGARPAEVCQLRPCDLDRSGPVWLFNVEDHKTAHHGGRRTICVGPKGQGILLKYLARDPEAFCFRPVDSESKRLAAVNAARVTPLSCGNRPGSNRKRRPKRSPGDRYEVASYRRAIHRACDRAKVSRWSPNQLRHAAATSVRRQFGIEAAQHVLGHAKTDMTEIYAERNVETAARIMAAIG